MLSKLWRMVSRPKTRNLFDPGLPTNPDLHPFAQNNSSLARGVGWVGGGKFSKKWHPPPSRLTPTGPNPLGLTDYVPIDLFVAGLGLGLPWPTVGPVLGTAGVGAGYQRCLCWLNRAWVMAEPQSETSRKGHRLGWGGGADALANLRTHSIFWGVGEDTM